MLARRTRTRGRPAWLRALGRADPPDRVACHGAIFRRVEVFKHDSWAATARYELESFTAEPPNLHTESAAPPGIVCKFNRCQPICGVPMSWLGRRLAAREAQAYRKLAGVDGIAASAGPITDKAGRPIRHAVAHEFIPGQPLHPDAQIDVQFFQRLSETLENVHAAGIAYVDLHKRENVLLAENGTPYLIDFQVSFQLATGWLGRTWIQRWLLAKLQGMDRFCLAKHVRKHLPDRLQALGLETFAEPPGWIRWHRRLAVPLRGLRRRFLSLIQVRDASGRVSSERFTEHALRCELSEGDQAVRS